jgi:hypothetical protein
MFDLQVADTNLGKISHQCARIRVNASVHENHVGPSGSLDERPYLVKEAPAHDHISRIAVIQFFDLTVEDVGVFPILIVFEQREEERVSA